MNIRKITAPIMAEILLLYKNNIPLKIIAKVFDVSEATVRDNLPKSEKQDTKDFQEPSAEKRLTLLKIYAWLVSDEADCAVHFGTPAIAKAKPFLFEYLNLKDWQRFLEGVIACANIAQQNRINESIDTNYLPLINAVLPPITIKTTGDQTIETALKMMHNESLSFPSCNTLNKPAVALHEFIQKHIAPKETFVRYFDEVFIEHLNVLIDSTGDRPAEAIREAFDLPGKLEITLTQKYRIGPEAVRNWKSKGLRRLGRRLYGAFENPLSVTILQQRTIRDTQQSVRETSVKLTDAQKHTKSLQEKLSLVCKHALGISPLSPEIRSILNEYREEELPPLDPSLETILNTPIEDLDLSVRAFNCLKAAKISSLRDLVQYEREDLMSIEFFGQKSLSEIGWALEERGLTFGMIIG